MKRAKKLYILLGVLAAACLATVIALGVEEYKEQIRTSDAVILEIPTEEVTALSWEYQEEALAFHKEEDTWLYDQDEAFPVDPEKIEGAAEKDGAHGPHWYHTAANGAAARRFQFHFTIKGVARKEKKRKIC